MADHRDNLGTLHSFSLRRDGVIDDSTVSPKYHSSQQCIDLGADINHVAANDRCILKEDEYHSIHTTSLTIYIETIESWDLLWILNRADGLQFFLNHDAILEFKIMPPCLSAIRYEARDEKAGRRDIWRDNVER
ncbi:hypothetical protein VTL71DRAFT_15796 [Oculimacula yallundae]|uniref:Uncharacterized protein n=1 Tax=Oculimacula yallundae TaxID=86028 RepID=A0ABR4CCP0_9HELO